MFLETLEDGYIGTLMAIGTLETGFQNMETLEIGYIGTIETDYRSARTLEIGTNRVQHWNIGNWLYLNIGILETGFWIY